MKSGKIQTREGTELPNQERIMTLGEKENYKYLGILKVGTIYQAEKKDKNTKRKPRKNAKTSRNPALQQKSHLRDKYPSSLLCKELGIITKMGKWVT